MRKIFSSPQFEKKLIRFLQKNPEYDKKIKIVFRLLEKDIYHPTLKTHRLHGKLSFWFSCSITYQYRLAFSFDSKFIYPHTVGNHDDVY